MNDTYFDHILWWCSVQRVPRMMSRKAHTVCHGEGCPIHCKCKCVLSLKTVKHEFIHNSLKLFALLREEWGDRQTVTWCLYGKTINLPVIPPTTFNNNNQITSMQIMLNTWKINKHICKKSSSTLHKWLKWCDTVCYCITFGLKIIFFVANRCTTIWISQRGNAFCSLPHFSNKNWLLLMSVNTCILT